MRTEFFAQADGWTRTKVNREARWAAKIHKIDGGWIAWESIEDYETWRQQR